MCNRFCCHCLLCCGFVVLRTNSFKLLRGQALVTCGFWSAVLPAIMDPNNGLAIWGITGRIGNANLYFFSWGGLAMSFFVLYDFLKEKYGEKIFSPSTWGALCLTSFITMISASRMWQDLICDADMPDGFLKDACNRTAWAVAAGTIGSLVAAVWPLCGMFLSGYFADMMESGFSLLMLIIWTFAVGYVTFGGEKAPASDIGNLYFFTWFSFAISVYLAMNGINLVLNRNNTTDSNEAQTSNEADEKMMDQGEPESEKHEDDVEA
jgi:hypothetical protein